MKERVCSDCGGVQKTLRIHVRHTDGPLDAARRLGEPPLQATLARLGRIRGRDSHEHGCTVEET
jgi:hypothetical protein